jgi:hypothetical protein
LLVWRGVFPVRAVGTSSACGVAIGLASAVGYALHAPDGALPQFAVGYVYLPAAIGVAATSMLAAPFGTRLAHRLDGASLKRVFAGFLVAVSLGPGRGRLRSADRCCRLWRDFCPLVACSQIVYNLGCRFPDLRRFAVPTRSRYSIHKNSRRENP